MVLEAEPTIYQKYTKVFKILDFIFFILFSLEYILRLLFCGTLKKYQGFIGKIRYIFSPMAIVDLIAILPNILMFFYSRFSFVKTLKIN